MKLSLLLSVAALVRQTTCNGPNLGVDPNTIADCLEWYDNGSQQTCEEVRDYWAITPEMFHKWNPSVGLDCKPWEYQSYCILSQERLDDTARTATTSGSSGTTKPTATTGSSTLGPSPTPWIPHECYVESSTFPVLKENVSPAGGDSALTIPKCKNTCYLRSYKIAGVQEGNQCWCGNYINGEWTSNGTDCKNVPCTGDEKTFCGGKGFINVFGAESNAESPVPETVVVTMSVVSSAGSGAGTALSATQSSGARRNRALF